MVAPLLVQIHGSMVITASSRDGLQVWSLESRQLLASLSPNARTDKDTRQTGIAPSSLAVSNTTLEDRIAVVVGFQAGHFCLYEVERVTSGIEYTDLRTAIQAQYRIGLLFDHAATNDDPITGVACESHYIATINGAQLLSLYLVSPKPQGGGSLAYPKLLSSLRSHTAWPPLCLSLRVQASGIIASVAYALPTYLAGWTVGLQELRITLEGIVIQSRLASAAQHGFIPLSRPPTARSTPRAEPTRGFEIHNSTSQPTSLSYSHPYLLASHADNTLTLYLAHSSEAGLNISSAYRLWGHTSSVSDVQVGDRGRAVSTATTGGVRVWELEGIPRKRGQGEGGVEVRSKSPMPHLEAKDSVATSIRGAGFDEERILLLCTEAEGQKLVVYNFNK
ncbi:MAG: hypothetical protein MMC23_007569 [Stictis urceolatum]|nr:hypothetical protein [Stictis urceolata]